MEQIKIIPTEILNIVPKYDGNSEQNLYVFHSLTSKLTDRAAYLLSNHHTITSWQELKELLIQHFGDHRSEECIALELENLKIQNGESFTQFYHRIENVKSSLFAKLKKVTDEEIKASRMIVYNDIALNVFLYNLPEDIIHKVRLKSCPTLESALSIATEEANFLEQYKARNRSFGFRPDFRPPYRFYNGNLFGGQLQSNTGQGNFGQGLAQPCGSTFLHVSNATPAFGSPKPQGSSLFGTQSLPQQTISVQNNRNSHSHDSSPFFQSQSLSQNLNQGLARSFGSMFPGDTPPSGNIDFGSQENQQGLQFGTQNQQHAPEVEQEDSKSVTPKNDINLTV